MGDRNNPIKFGPEWLRNLARERNASNPAANAQNVPGASGTVNSLGAIASSPNSSTPVAGGSQNTAINITQKIYLAKLRYGREEMLALYDRTVEAPAELKSIDQLYQPRGKPPFALLNTFDDDMRESLRCGPPIGVINPERFGAGRGLGRGLAVTDNRGRPRMPFVRQPSLGRGNPSYHPRIPSYGAGPDEDPSVASRSWNNSNGSPSSNRNGIEQQEWTLNKTFRSKRQTNNTNWRSPQTREDGEEWRLSDAARPRTGPQDKWERDWGERPNQDKSSSWNTNRRTWGGDTQTEENLPEWAMDNAEACAGTFDSSGAFHGYSNDDTNLPKNQEASYSLTRSHTHGSFARLKSVEDGSEEWWASSKAKKLSPKKFDASDIKFKKQVSIGSADESTSTSSNSKQTISSKEESNVLHDMQDKQLTSAESSDSGLAENTFNKKNSYQQKFSENKTFDALMRSDINMEEASDERGNFQSVTIKPNNSLRQKHQNIVSSMTEGSAQQSRNASLLQGFQEATSGHNTEKEVTKLSGKSPEEQIVEEIFDITLEDKEIFSKLPSAIGLPPNTTSTVTGKVTTVMSVSQGSNSVLQNTVSSHNLSNQSNLISKQNIPMPGMHTTGLLQNSMQSLGMQTSVAASSGIQTTGVLSHLQTSGVQSGMQPHGLHSPGVQAPGMQSPGLQAATLQSLGLQAPGQKTAGLSSPGIHTQGHMQNSMHVLPTPGSQASSIQSHGLQLPGMQAPGMQALGLQSLGMPSSALQGAGNPVSSLQNVGISNSALNSAMRLQRPRLIDQSHTSNAMTMPLQRMSPPLLMNPAMSNSAIGGGTAAGMPGFPNPPMQGMTGTNNSLFGLNQNPNNSSMPSSNDIQMPNHGQSNVFPIHGLQHSGNQGTFTSSLYGNMMQSSPSQSNPSSQNLIDQWFYEDPEKKIQGPFSSKEMYNWYRAGFFSPSLMVRRACDTHMRPLGSYGTVVPFAQMDMPPFPMSGGFGIRNQGSHDSLMNSQSGLGLDVMNMSNINVGENPIDSLQFGTVGLVRNPPFNQPQMESLWSQTPSSPDLMWMQQTLNSRNEMRVNNLPMYFWDQQPSAVTSTSLLPEEIVKEMKTEDQILAQMRASQGVGSMPFTADQGNPPVVAIIKPGENNPTASATPNLEELHKLIQKDTLIANAEKGDSKLDSNDETANKKDKINKQDQLHESIKVQETVQSKPQESKQAKQNKNESEKSAKNKDNNQKAKNKKSKEEKKEDITDAANKEEDTNKAEKKSEDLSPTKNKKEDKVNKKEMEKEKKEWIKEGFTIVKSSEKNTKENKKKAEEIKAAEEAERKRKEEERLATEEEKKRKQTESLKKQQEQKQQQQRQAAEIVMKKAPWSAVSAAHAQQATSKEGPTLAEIQRLEREKKLEQIKEQQQMMQVMAQQQAAALAREQEMQAGLGWAKKKPVNTTAPGLTLAEIQAEARKQSAAAAAVAASEATATAAAASAQILEESASQANHTPWGNTHNGGGFWDSPAPNQVAKPVEKTQEPTRVPEQNVKTKKKNTLNIPPKKESSPVAEFDTWCNTVLASWSAKIDVPTFVGFLKDIESPYEVKDYVKCYLGETKDSSDFARHFLEKRSKLLRVGMVTPSDDLCSPAVAVNPRTISGSDYQEVKGKPKKTKKNKMLKVDARILGFSVTASEDRINVGDIDTV